MLGEGNRETGDKEAMTVAVGMMSADGRQPLSKRGLLDGAQDLAFRLYNIAELEGGSRRQLLEYLDHQRLRGGNPAVQRLAGGAGLDSDGIRKCGLDAPQQRLR